MEDFSTLQQDISAALVATTRTTSELAGEDLPFHRSLDAQLAARLDGQNARLLTLATSLLGTATSAEETVRLPPSLKDVDSIDGNWRTVVDVIDSLLERADTAMDEFTGAVKRLSPGVESQAATARVPKTSKIATQLQAQDLAKPQLLFEVSPNNHEDRPFKPLLLNKPHASRSLEFDPALGDAEPPQQYSHPYQLEIEQYRYPASVYTHAEPIKYHPFEATTATFVDTEAALIDMLEELKQAKEIAIDLEHHDQRSYIGIVSLMQISTRDRDWIVDTLKPWRRKLQVLNEVFADPSKVKVLHGAFMDVLWLQRDLGLYLVGLFDTHYASRALGYAGGSLAFLLKKFANVDAQKQYQTADWRVRPLPQELFDYARSDTHYLLYIFDCMRNELIERSDMSLQDGEGDRIWHVLEKSSETALQRYEHPVYDPDLGLGSQGWYKMLTRTPAIFTKVQFAVFRAVHQWRDKVAREQDDSIHYVMPNHQIFSIARDMPTNRAALIGIAQPTTQTVRLRADELVATIIRAKKTGEEGPEMLDVLNRVEPHSSTGALRKPEVKHTVAAFAPSGNTPTDNGIMASTLPIRSTESAFWGSAFKHNVHERRQSMSTIPNISLAIPMPSLNAEVFAEPIETPTKSQSPVAAEEPLATAPVEEDDDVFVLKELGKKRKRAVDMANGVSYDGMAAQSDEVALSGEIDVEAERLREKAESKKAKKEAKRAARAATEGGAAPLNVNDEPFDYASAPSILNPTREARGANGPKKKTQEAKNPYAKSLDAPRGLPRVQKERAGKSVTYR